MWIIWIILCQLYVSGGSADSGLTNMLRIADTVQKLTSIYKKTELDKESAWMWEKIHNGYDERY